MPVSLANLRDRRALATKDLGEFGTLNIWYNVGKISPGYFQAKRDNPHPEKEFLVELNMDLVVDWDIQDENGEKLPITHEVMRELDYALLNLINDMVKEASDPLKQSGKP